MFKPLVVRMLLVFSALSVLFISACGGGGGGNSNSNQVPGIQKETISDHSKDNKNAVMHASQSVRVPLLKEAWQRELEKQVWVMEFPISLYTWENRSSFVGSNQTGELDPKDKGVTEFLFGEASKFWDAKEAISYVGPNGVYFSTDPLASREWGAKTVGKIQNRNSLDQVLKDETWSVTEVTLPRGARVLDGRREDVFGPDLTKFVNSYSCHAISMRKLLDQQRGISDLERRNCWKVYTKMAEDSAISAVSLYFYAFGPAECGMHSGSHATDFVVFDKDVLKDSVTLVKEIPQTDFYAQDRKFIQDYFQVSLNDMDWICKDHGEEKNWEQRFGNACTYYKSAVSHYTDPWNPGATSQAKVSSDFGVKIQQKILGCQQAVSPRGAISPSGSANLSR